MSKGTRFVDMVVHAETIAAAAAGRDQARSLGTIANRPEAIRRLLGKLGNPAKLTGTSLRSDHDAPCRAITIPRSR